MLNKELDIVLNRLNETIFKKNEKVNPAVFKELQRAITKARKPYLSITKATQNYRIEIG